MENEIEIEKFTIYLTPKAYLKIKYYTQHIDSEIGGLLEIEYVNNKLIVTDVILIKQEAGAAAMNLDQEALSELTANNNTQKIRGWWHSHDTMACFWSGTDEETIETLKNFFKDFVISINTSKNESDIDIKIRIDVFRPNLVLDNIDFKIAVVDNERLRNSCIKEIEEKVNKSFFQQPTNFDEFNYNKFWNDFDRRKYGLP